MTPDLPAIPTRAVGWGAGSWEYDDLITEGMCLAIDARQKIGSYEGDLLYIVRDGDRYGFLTFGYGSCSGCDSLQACSTVEDLTELRDGLYESIRWQDNREAFVKWLGEYDFEGMWYFHEREAREFIEAQKSRLGSDDGEAS